MSIGSTDLPNSFDNDLPEQDGSNANTHLPTFGQLLLHTIQEVITAVVIASVIALALNFFIMQVTYIHGKSMEPNLHTDQRLMIEKLSYQFLAPQRGDIVVINIEQSPLPLIKRVVGLPGEIIEIYQNQVFIDGQPLNEPYLADITQSDYGPVEVSDKHIFVMGDNRNVSHDSRFFGPVQVGSVIGKAWLSYWPLEDIGPVQ